MCKIAGVIEFAALVATAFAIPAAEPPTDSPYGVHAHVTRGDEYPFLPEELKLFEQAGIAWLRTGFVWPAIERQEGRWDFARCDDVVARSKSAGVQIMGLLHGAPRWADPPLEHIDQWLGFVRTTVGRYKGRVPAWQVWNEPNLRSFWKNPNPEHYASLLKATHDEIKRVDPRALVVWGATSQLDWTFLTTALTHAEGKFDVMAIHPYGYEDPCAPEAYIPDALDDLRKLMKAHGVDDRPIWFTEWGWPAHTGRRGMSDRQQGQYVARAYLLALHAGLQRGFWYEFQENRAADEVNEDAFGLVEFDLKPKPAYQAYRTLIAARPPGSRPLSRPWKTGLIYHPAWMRPDGVRVHAVWAVWGRWNSPRMTPVLLKGKVTEAYDYLGRPVRLEEDSSGRTLLPLDWGSPIYLIGPQQVAFE